MPLEHSKSPGAFKRNIKVLTSEIGKSPHVQSRAQAIAIAESIKRRGRQMGGRTVKLPHFSTAGQFSMARSPHIGLSGAAAMPERHMMKSMTRGALLTATPGRADLHKTFVPSGSYVIPADVVSGRGQGNTLAGTANLNQLFGMGPYGGGKAGPYGASPSKLHVGKAPKLPKPAGQNIGVASGGGKSDSGALGEPVPVNLSGGEIVVPPENLIKTFIRIFPGKKYTLKQIHAIMDQWVLHERKHHRKTLAKLPPPAKD